jgi:uncharacterized membrane protein YccC
MVRWVIIGLCALVAAVIACAVVGWKKAEKLFLTGKRKRLLRLRALQDRLKPVISSLLEQVNDLDQERQYQVQSESNEWSARMAAVCEDVVRLGDALTLIDRTLGQEDLRHSRRVMLVTCRLASKVSREIRDIRQVTVAISVKEDPAGSEINQGRSV